MFGDLYIDSRALTYGVVSVRSPYKCRVPDLSGMTGHTPSKKNQTNRHATDPNQHAKLRRSLDSSRPHPRANGGARVDSRGMPRARILAQVVRQAHALPRFDVGRFRARLVSVVLFGW